MHSVLKKSLKERIPSLRSSLVFKFLLSLPSILIWQLKKKHLWHLILKVHMHKEKFSQKVLR